MDIMIKNLCFSSITTFILNRVLHMVFQFFLFFRKQIEAYSFLTEKILRQICIKARFYPSAELLDELKLLNLCDYYTVGFLKSLFT